MKKPILNILLTGIIGTCLIAGGAYYYTLSNPRHSFYQVAKALKTHDIELFNKYVDVDAVIDEWVLWGSEKAKSDLKQIKGSHANPIEDGFVELLMPNMRLKLKEEFKKTIAENIRNSKDGSIASGMPIMSMVFLPIKTVSVQGTTAAISVDHPRSNDEIIFKMRRVRRHFWRIFSIQIPSLMERERKLPLPPARKETAEAEPEAPNIPDTPIAPGITLNKEAMEITVHPQETSKVAQEREDILTKTILYTEYAQAIKDKVTQTVAQNYKGAETGKVALELVILSNGKFKEVKIVEEKSEASQKLKDTALRSAKNAAPYPAFPEALHSSELGFSILIAFEK
ncbi:MAG: energy transducer TonB [Candidatus Omnitrophota bacterium]